MKYEAVIFDLFGTLVDKYPLDIYREELREMAAAVSVPQDEFSRLWFATYSERGTGIYQTYEANVEYICRELGVEIDNSRVGRAVEICREYGRRLIKTKPHAVELLKSIRDKGCKTGLISDCGVEVPRMFGNLPVAPLLDVTVFSCQVGVQKPDPGIYRIATERLGVTPERCIFFGDGDDNELSGAKNAGMNAVLIRNPGEENDNVHRENYEGVDWKGPVIQSLSEVLTLVE